LAAKLDLFLMSRRDIVVNTLIGIFLISVFLSPFLLALVALAYIVRPVGQLLKTFLPGLSDPEDLLFFCVFCASFLVEAIRRLRKRQWTGAFLFLAGVPMLLSSWLARSYSPLGLNGHFWIVCILPMFFAYAGLVLTRIQFLLTASAISAIVAINTGLLGVGTLAYIAADCVWAGLLIWFAMDVRSTRGVLSHLPL
jgi:hypothetical protein